MQRNFVFTAAAAALVLWTAGDLRARNVDLSTVPQRDTVQLTIYNSEDLTLVRETRKVSFNQGVNSLQFSWANTLIDPTSIELRLLTNPDKITLLDTTFPHDKPQMLYWNVQSELDGEATVEITYFTSGITWSADYVCTANQDETRLQFEGFVRVTNSSGEEYENAQIRLVVGQINLVEKIAELAKVRLEDVEKMDADKLARARGAVVRRAMALPEAAAPMDAAAAEAPPQPKEIIKEGLSEYFIYTVEGTETIPHGWSKRMRSFEGQTVPFEIQYRYRQTQYGDQLVRMYLLTNDEASKLGTTPLPDGTVRVFRDNGRDGLSFLVAQSVNYVPIGDKIELNLGVDPEVQFELVKLRVWRDNVWMQLQGANVYRRVDQPNVQIDVRSTVAGWDDHTVFAQRVRNHTPKPIKIEVRRTFDGHTVFRSELGPHRTTITRSSTAKPFPPDRNRTCATRCSRTRAATASRTTSPSRRQWSSHEPIQDAPDDRCCGGRSAVGGGTVRPSQQRGPVHGPGPGQRAADHLQLGRPYTGPRNPQGQLQEGRQPAAIQLGQYADRSHVGRIAVPVGRGQAGRAGYHLPPRQTADALLAREQRAGRRRHGRDHLLHQRDHLVGRLPGYRRPGRVAHEPRGIRPRHEQLGRGL